MPLQSLLFFKNRKVIFNQIYYNKLVQEKKE